MTYPGYFEKVLGMIGAPITNNNLSILLYWAKHEGGNASFNSLNTTMKAPGTTDYNSAGVKNYPNIETGINATAKTLLLNYYKPIVNALRANKSISFYYGNQDIIKALTTWGTVNFANELKKGTGLAPAATKPPTSIIIAAIAAATAAYLLTR